MTEPEKTTVQSLIKELQEFPSDAEIRLLSYEDMEHKVDFTYYNEEENTVGIRGYIELEPFDPSFYR